MKSPLLLTSGIFVILTPAGHGAPLFSSHDREGEALLAQVQDPPASRHGPPARPTVIYSSDLLTLSMHGKMIMMPTLALAKRPTSSALIGRWPLVLLALLFNAAPAHATDDMLIYSDRFHNGWGDNWSCMPRYPTNNPVHSGSKSMAFVPGGQWQAWWLKAGTAVDTTIYTNVSFWLYGSTGGQSVGIAANWVARIQDCRPFG